MNSLGQHLASGLNIAFDTQVQRVERNNKTYALVDTEQRRLGEFDVVLWNCPPSRLCRCCQRCRLSHRLMRAIGVIN